MRHDFGLSARRYVVTGAASGIGSAIASSLEEADAEILRLDRVPDAEGCVTSADVVDRDALRLAIDDFGRNGLDGVVHCAGLMRRASLDDDSAAASWDETVQVNLSGAFNVVQASRPHFRQRASVVLIASIQSFIHLPNSVAYSASKGGVAMLARAMAHELGPKGVRVNAIAPGPILTAMTRAAFQNEAVLQRNLSRMPLGRLGEPEDIVGPTLFLLSDTSAFVTGTVLPVDGGFLVS